MLAIVALLLTVTGHAAFGEDIPALIDRLRGEVLLIRHEQTAAPRSSTILARDDKIRTGPASRVLVSFQDGSRLLIGENADVVLEEMVPEQGRQRATLMLQVVRGAFRLTTTEPAQAPDRRVQVRAGGAIIRGRSTDLWSGPIDGARAILVIAGQAQVLTDAGSVMLNRNRSGTTLRSRHSSPEEPWVWPKDMVQRALTMVAFD